MNTKTENSSAQASWFVGASYGGTDDQLPRFLSEGIWENGYEDKHLDVVRSMRPGDRIAVKSSYTRKHGLPRLEHLRRVPAAVRFVAELPDRARVPELVITPTIDDFF